ARGAGLWRGGDRGAGAGPAVESAPAMKYILSHQVLEEILQKQRIKSNDRGAIDKLFGGADVYYWYHTLRHLCPKKEVIVWNSLEAMRAAVQGHEDETAAEAEVK